MKSKKGFAQVFGLIDAGIALLVLFLVVGTGVFILDKYAGTSGLTGSAVNAISNGTAALGDINDTWGSLLVTIIVLVLILTLIIGGIYALVARGRR